MADFMREVDALFDIIKREVEELRTQDPEHELLKFASPVLEIEKWVTDVHLDFLNQFNPNGTTSWVAQRAAYSVAIRRALGRIPPEAANE